MLRAVEARFEQPQILGARRNEGAIANDPDVVLAKRVSNAKQISSRDRAIGVVSSAADCRFIGLFVQACLMSVVSMCANQITPYRNHQSRAAACGVNPTRISLLIRERWGRGIAEVFPHAELANTAAIVNTCLHEFRPHPAVAKHVCLLSHAPRTGLPGQFSLTPRLSRKNPGSRR